MRAPLLVLALLTLPSVASAQNCLSTGTTLTTQSAQAVNSVTAQTAQVSTIQNASTVNVLATNPGGTFFQDGNSDVVKATNPPGIQNVPAITGTVSNQNVVTAVNSTSAPYLTAAQLNQVAVPCATTTNVTNVTNKTVNNATTINNNNTTNTNVVNNATTINNITNMALAESQIREINASFDQRFNAMQAQITYNQLEARRAIAAVAAMAPVLMPSKPGKTVVAVSSGFFLGEAGVGVGVTHRLNTATPIVLFGSYANGGGNAHVTRVGGAFEF